VKAAFYRGTRPGLPGIYNRGVRWWTRSPYSHCELIFNDGMAASSSFMDGGVRFKRIDFDPEHWDFVDLPAHLEPTARAWFAAHAGQPYDLLGNLHFLLGPVADDKFKWFCSESIAAALGIADPWRYDPGVLASALSSIGRPEQDFDLTKSPA
jgi:hypothetical protein